MRTVSQRREVDGAWGRSCWGHTRTAPARTVESAPSLRPALRERSQLTAQVLVESWGWSGVSVATSQCPASSTTSSPRPPRATSASARCSNRPANLQPPTTSSSALKVWPRYRTLGGEGLSTWSERLLTIVSILMFEHEHSPWYSLYLPCPRIVVQLHFSSLFFFGIPFFAQDNFKIRSQIFKRGILITGQTIWPYHIVD